MIALGIDIGISSVKVLALDSDGHVVAIASAPYTLQHDAHSGSFEVDPEDWWSATCQATRACLVRGSIDAYEIAVLGLSGSMSSVVLIDRSGKAIRPAMLLSDARGSEEVQAIPAALPRRVHEQHRRSRSGRILRR
jgi:xylulokinase